MKKLILGLLLPIAACAQSKSDSPQEMGDRMRSDAEKNHPNDPVAAGLESNASARKVFSGLVEDHPEIPEKLAASAFIGYYTKYVYSIPDSCSKAGAPTPRLSSSIAAANRPFLGVASGIVNAPSAIQEARKMMDHFAQSELERMAIAQGTDVKSVCEGLESNFESLSQTATFSLGNPEGYRILAERLGH